MNATLSKLLSHVYEMEGLLLVMEKHGHETPREVLDMLKNKAVQVAHECELLQLPPQPEQPIAAAQQPEPEPMPDPEPIPEPIPEPEPEPEPMPEVDDEDDAPARHDDDEDGYKEIFGGTQDYVEPLRVDEKLQRDLSRDLRKAFSINDRFRFRRELFENSDALMADALDMVESMHSMDEAEDYFYNELGWEPDNDEVAAFMAVVKHHFS